MSNYTFGYESINVLKELYGDIESKERKEYKKKVDKFNKKLKKILKE